MLYHGFDAFVYWPEEDPVGQIRRFSDLVGEISGVVATERG